MYPINSLHSFSIFFSLFYLAVGCILSTQRHCQSHYEEFSIVKLWYNLRVFCGDYFGSCVPTWKVSHCKCSWGVMWTVKVCAEQWLSYSNKMADEWHGLLADRCICGSKRQRDTERLSVWEIEREADRGGCGCRRRCIMKESEKKGKNKREERERSTERGRDRRTKKQWDTFRVLKWT